jgi:hypothetical protein
MLVIADVTLLTPNVSRETGLYTEKVGPATLSNQDQVHFGDAGVRWAMDARSAS